MHGVMHIGKMVNAKVRNYDLRDLSNEMNKSLEPYWNKRIEWLEIWHYLGNGRVSSWLSSLLVISMCIAS